MEWFKQVDYHNICQEDIRRNMQKPQIKHKNYCGYKTKYTDRISCTVVNENINHCLDFDFEDIDTIKTLMELLKKADSFIYSGSKEEKEFNDFEKFQESKEKKWTNKLYSKIEDISLQIYFFDWKKRIFYSKETDKGHLMLSRGFQLGPLVITWG